MSEPKKVDRRNFLYAGLGAVALIAVGAAAYVAMNPPVVTQTATSVVTTAVPTTSVITTTVPTTSVVTTTSVATTTVPTTITYKPPTKVQLAVPNQGLTVLGPLELAKREGYFAEFGLEPDFPVLKGGAGCAQALIAESIDFANIATMHAMKAYVQGYKLYGIANAMLSTIFTITVKKNILPGIENKPVDERVKALKGLKIGIVSPGSGSDVYLRYICKKYAGLDPDRDIEIVAIGSETAIGLAALEKGDIDAFILVEPAGSLAEYYGIGRIIANFARGDFPEFMNMSDSSITTRKAFAERNPEICSGIVKAFAKAVKTWHENRDKTLKILKEIYSEMPPEVVEKVYDNTLNCVPKDISYNSKLLQDTCKILIELGFVDKELPMEEIYTNKFVSG